MKIRLLSDLHQEFFEDKTLYESRGEDVLVIAGDLTVGSEKIIEALKKFAKHAKEVVYVPGNHEYYGADKHYRQKIATIDLRVLAETRGTNIHFMNPGFRTFGDVTFIGATLWTNFRDNHFSRIRAADNINDFRMIKDFSTTDCVDLNTSHTKFFREAYNLPGKKVFVSHFLPAIECIDPQFQGQSILNDYFANDMGNWLGDMQNSTWLFGHTHNLVDRVLGDTRVVANPYGYYQNKNYIEKIIEV